MLKIGLIVAHDHKAQGAVSFHNKNPYTENIWSKEVLDECANILTTPNFQAIVVRRGVGMNYDEINDVYKSLGGVDLSLELHFNSFHSATARGQEMLVYNVAEDIRIAKHICEHLFNVAGISRRRDKGAFILNIGDRGSSNLSKVIYAKHKMLYEPAFGNHDTADSRYIFNTGKFASDLAEAIASAMDIDLSVDNSATIIKQLREKIQILNGIIDFKSKKVEEAMAMLEEANEYK